MDSLQQNQHYTYTDYLNWDGKIRYELINGQPYMMSPAPSRKHQKISAEILRQLANYLKNKPCEVYGAPFDVRLNADKSDKEDDTVVQPDLVIICDQSKLDDKGCNGTPDMVVEILSPSTESRDRFLKFNLYLEAGVREYWIVDPESKTVSVHILNNGKYVTDVYGKKDGNFNTISVHVLDGCIINLNDVFSSI